ncbi:MAG: HPr(Ser) kinase/phosphatase [Mariprofundaceae bacterium]|nr:HPr(Ser) kinase/phosphatase [Mariprofundaceae bacterium]
MSAPLRITLGEIFSEQGEAMQMRLITGEQGLYRYIDHPRMQKPSLAFAGFLENLNDYRLQVIGQTELHYLATKPPQAQKRAVDAVFDLKLAGVVITRGIEPPAIIRDAAERTQTPLFVSALESSTFMTDMLLFLSKRLAPKTWQHGVYMDIYGLGVLLTGASGIGKSEIGLELISRGHRFIADDMVELVRSSPGILVGHSPEALRYHMELRGLGVVNIRDLYGAAAITDTKRVRLVIELIAWEKMNENDRIMDEDDMICIHKVDLPRVRIPIRPGRSLAVIIEVATRNQLLKQRGIDSNKDFVQALEDRIRDDSKGN